MHKRIVIPAKAGAQKLGVMTNVHAPPGFQVYGAMRLRPE